MNVLSRFRLFLHRRRHAKLMRETGEVLAKSREMRALLKPYEYRGVTCAYCGGPHQACKAEELRYCIQYLREHQCKG